MGGADVAIEALGTQETFENALRSFGLQVWSQHNATLAGIMKTSFVPLAHCLLLLVVAAIPLLILEIMKIVRQPPPRRVGNIDSRV